MPHDFPIFVHNYRIWRNSDVIADLQRIIRAEEGEWADIDGRVEKPGDILILMNKVLRHIGHAETSAIGGDYRFVFPVPNNDGTLEALPTDAALARRARRDDITSPVPIPGISCLADPPAPNRACDTARPHRKLPGRNRADGAPPATATLPSPDTVTSDPSPCGRLGPSSARTRHAAHGGNTPVCNGKRPRGTSNPPPPAALCPSARTPEPYCRESTCVDPRRIFTTTTGTSGGMAGSTTRPTSQDMVGHRGCQG